MLKLAFWNCRGILRKYFWMELEIFYKLEHIQIMALADTKNEICPPENI